MKQGIRYLLVFSVLMSVLLAGFPGARAQSSAEASEPRIHESPLAVRDVGLHSGNKTPSKTGQPRGAASTAQAQEEGLASPVAEESENAASLLEKGQSLLAEGAVELHAARSAYGRQYELPSGRTAALLSAAPAFERSLERAWVRLKGEPPSPTEELTGCPFASRCPQVEGRCAQEIPPLEQRAKDHVVACHFSADAVDREE